MKIGDFGSAVKESEKQSNGGQFKIEGFTTWYKSPEVLFGSRSYGYEIDIWGVGCIVGEMILGIPLFPGSNDFHQISRISDLIGTPNEERWPEMRDLPSYGKLQFIDNQPIPFAEFFWIKDQNALHLLQCCLKYGERMPAGDLLQLSWLTNEQNQKRGSNLLAIAFNSPIQESNNEDIFKI